MKILITGNLGYIGPVVVKYLKDNFLGYKIYGLDTGFFSHSLTAVNYMPEVYLESQIFKDVRSVTIEDFRDFDSVVHLSAISNDPMGKEFEKVTKEINQDSSVAIAKLCSQAGVKNFVFASSCSMYGQAEGDKAKSEQDPTNPLTAYAKSKIGTEEALKAIDLGDMVVTSLRFATACGMSPRLRLDLMLNDFVACALTSGEITVLSDGSPWRPLIDVKDMARAISWALKRPESNGGKFLAVNAGSNLNNHQVKDFANMVKEVMPITKVSINLDAPPDKRSYKVDFSLFKTLAPDYQPQVNLRQSIEELTLGIKRINDLNSNFRDSKYMRLVMLRSLISSNQINHDLFWINK
jgi:nucleoside-diphosphate-sugar epimerase